MKYPKRLHEALESLAGVTEVSLSVRPLDGLDERAFALPGELGDLPHLMLRRGKGQANEHLVTAEIRFSQDMTGWIALEFLSWWVRDLSRSGRWIQMRSLALPPAAYGTQLGRTLKIVIEFLFKDSTENLDSIDKELASVAESLQSNLKDYADALARPTQARPKDVDALRQCAENQDCQAQLYLAQRYASGDGVTKDPEQAFTWFGRSAVLGHPEAQLHLGRCYALGTGTRSDATKAVELYRQAADAGLPLAMGHLGECYENGTGVEKDEAEAARWYQKGAQGGEVTCIAQLGECYEYGRGVQLDLHQALAHYRKALEHGFDPVQPAIARVESAIGSD